jgi:hypothetical protein
VAGSEELTRLRALVAADADGGAGIVGAALSVADAAMGAAWGGRDVLGSPSTTTSVYSWDEELTNDLRQVSPLEWRITDRRPELAARLRPYQLDPRWPEVRLLAAVCRIHQRIDLAREFPPLDGGTAVAPVPPRDEPSADEVAARLVSSLHLPPAEAIAVAPPVPGVYAWWSSLPEIGGVRGTELDGGHLYFVGFADRSDGQDLAARLRDHVRGTTRSSLDRLAFTALLASERGRSRLVDTAVDGADTANAVRRDDEEALSDWLHSYATLSWVEVEHPGAVLAEVIDILRPAMQH